MCYKLTSEFFSIDLILWTFKTVRSPPSCHLRDSIALLHSPLGLFLEAARTVLVCLVALFTKHPVVVGWLSLIPHGDERRNSAGGGKKAVGCPLPP